MSFQDDLLNEFGAEAVELLQGIEQKIFAIRGENGQVNGRAAGDAYRAVHTVKGAAGFVGLRKVSELAGGLAEVLQQWRRDEVAPKSDAVEVAAGAAQRLLALIHDAPDGQSEDVATHVVALQDLSTTRRSAPATR